MTLQYSNEDASYKAYEQNLANDSPLWIKDIPNAFPQHTSYKDLIGTSNYIFNVPEKTEYEIYLEHVSKGGISIYEFMRFV